MRSYYSKLFKIFYRLCYSLLRTTILRVACAFGNPEALAESGRQFSEWLKDTDKRPHPDIRSIVYYYGMQSVGNEVIWDQIWKVFISEQNAQEKQNLMDALTAIKEPWILQR